MKIILMSLLIISLSAFSSDEEGTGAPKTYNTDIEREQKILYICISTTQGGDEDKDKIQRFQECYLDLLKGDEEGTGEA